MPAPAFPGSNAADHGRGEVDHRLAPPLTTPEAMLVIHLMRHKWDEAPPRPAIKTLAKRIGISHVAVRNHARSLERKGCLRRIMRIGLANEFDLTPLFRKLESLRASEARGQAKGRRTAS